MQIEIENWGKTNYAVSLDRQRKRRDEWAESPSRPALIAVTEHCPSITIGKTGDCR